MKCTLCGFCFDPTQEEAACKHCPLRKGCKLIRCPNCGFETPPEPEWLEYFKKKSRKDEDKR